MIKQLPISHLSLQKKPFAFNGFVLSNAWFRRTKQMIVENITCTRNYLKKINLSQKICVKMIEWKRKEPIQLRMGSLTKLNYEQIILHIHLGKICNIHFELNITRIVEKEIIFA